ncbi:MAG: HypC/HybG/HupF family hydrogenase formation chaperone [Gemmatimonadales bacterium]|nr:HypC/HybG/HupF family hydrogenase formation chaperone [Gemmatimonadales bacterium]
MCLAIPGKVIEKYEDNGLPMGVIDFSGTRNTACLSYTPEAAVGHYVIVHAGFALQILNEEEALASLRELTRLSAFMEADAEEKAVAEEKAIADDDSRPDSETKSREK